MFLSKSAAALPVSRDREKRTRKSLYQSIPRDSAGPAVNQRNSEVWTIQPDLGKSEGGTGEVPV